ncbi:MAG: glycosyl transferase, partial [Magnetococcales bacterium]|nr:glycosyl transferase [Magnetococcales bacterium]
MLLRLLETMDRERVRNVVISMTDLGIVGPLVVDAGVPVHTLNMSRGVASLTALFRLRALLKREQADLLQTWLYHADLMGVIAGLVSRVPVLWSVRCSYVDMSRYPRSLRMVVSALSWFSRFPKAVVAN